MARQKNDGKGRLGGTFTDKEPDLSFTDGKPSKF